MPADHYELFDQSRKAYIALKQLFDQVLGSDDLYPSAYEGNMRVYKDQIKKSYDYIESMKKIHVETSRVHD